MNRLIIIGNGFDIAHGLPTKYSDFVKWYLIQLFKSLEKQNFKDAALQIHKKNITFTDKKYNISNIVNSLENNKDVDPFISEIINNPKQFTSTNTTIPYWFDFKFPLLKEICLLYVEKNWVDIENIFYQKLLSISKLEGYEESRNNAVDLLNKGMNYLKDKLEEYLNTLPSSNINFEILQILKSDLSPLPVANGKKDSNLILNFNYTNTISNYLQNLNGYNFQNIFIHGQVKLKKNPLVFGFGDEMDDHYKILEKTNYNGFLDNMKSFGYFRTGHYQQIANFIDSNEPYEVFVMGHSCGLSDRVMLNMIFEHNNCKSIRIFYHGDEDNNNYKVLTQEISRHFNKKNDMRLKIVPFENSIPFPQSC